MASRRNFLRQSAAVALGLTAFSKLSARAEKKVSNIGVQLYSVRKEMLADAQGTLEKLAKLGYKQLESARSEKGSFYGLTPKEMKRTCDQLGLTMRSGHIHVDENFQKSIEDAKEAGQEYLICSSMPTQGQTVDNYKQVAETFNKSGEASQKMGIRFGYHNHDYEFGTDNGKVLYDVLLENTDPKLVHMELDLGWVVASGKDPLDYFKRFPGRFPLWHLKDMNLREKHSTEFGKGGLNIAGMLKAGEQSGLRYFFVEQEEYTHTALESLKDDIDYLKKLSY